MCVQLSRRNQRFQLKAHSKHGNVAIYIPPDFEGPVTFSTRHGSTKFSNSIQQRLTHFGGADKINKAFIGAFPTSFADPGGLSKGAWDELDLSSVQGNIKVYYANEISEDVASPVSFIKKLFGGGAAGRPSPQTGGSLAGTPAIGDRKS